MKTLALYGGMYFQAKQSTRIHAVLKSSTVHLFFVVIVFALLLTPKASIAQENEQAGSSLKAERTQKAEEKSAKQQAAREAKKAERAKINAEKRAKQQAVREAKKVERAKINAEKRAKQQAAREAKKAERAKINAEKRAERGAKKDAQAAERKRKMVERQAKDQRRLEARQANLEKKKEQQEQACERFAALFVNMGSIPRSVLNRRFGGRASNLHSSVSNIPYESWFLADERFVAVFGHRYDDEPSNETTKLVGIMRNCEMPRNENSQAITDNMFLYRAYDPKFRPRYITGLELIRQMHSEISAAKKELSTLSADMVGFARWRDLAKQSKRLTSFLGLKAGDDFKSSLNKAYNSVVIPIHAREAEQVAAKAQGVEGLQRLSQLKAKFEADASLADIHPDWPAVAKTRQNALIKDIAEEQRDQIDAMGKGLSALQSGVQWYRNYHQLLRDTGLINNWDMRDLLDQFEQRRRTTLSATQTDLEKLIEKTRSRAELGELLERYLSLSSDAQGPAGKALLLHAANWAEELHKRAVLGLDSRGRNAGAAMQSQSGPSESVMYDLINQKVKSIAAGVQTMAGACGNSDVKTDFTTAMVCLTGKFMQASGAAQPMVITHFEKLGCAEASGWSGYNCDYTLQLRGGIQRSLGSALGSLMGQKGASQARFLETKDGWVAFFNEK